MSSIGFIIILSFKVKLFALSPDPEYYEGRGSEPDTNEVTSLSGKTIPRNHTIKDRELSRYSLTSVFIVFDEVIFILGGVKYLLVRLEDNSMNYPETQVAPTGKKQKNL